MASTRSLMQWKKGAAALHVWQKLPMQPPAESMPQATQASSTGHHFTAFTRTWLSTSSFGLLLYILKVRST